MQNFNEISNCHTRPAIYRFRLMVVPRNVSCPGFNDQKFWCQKTAGCHKGSAGVTLTYAKIPDLLVQCEFKAEKKPQTLWNSMRPSTEYIRDTLYAHQLTSCSPCRLLRLTFLLLGRSSELLALSPDTSASLSELRAAGDASRLFCSTSSVASGRILRLRRLFFLSKG